MDCCRAVDDSAVAEWVVAQVTVRVCPVELRCRRELGCGVAASSCIVGRTRALCSRTVVVSLVVRTSLLWLVVLLRTGLWTIVVRAVFVRAVGDIAVVRAVVVRAVSDIAVVVRFVVLAVVRTVLVLVAGINAALGADIAHMVVIVSASVHAGRVSAALSRVAVGRRLPVLRFNALAVLNRIVVVGPWL